MKNIPNLFFNSVSDILIISPQFKDLDKDYVIGSICDCILEFCSQCMRFNDVAQPFSSHVLHGDLIGSLLPYL